MVYFRYATYFFRVISYLDWARLDNSLIFDQLWLKTIEVIFMGSRLFSALDCPLHAYLTLSSHMIHWIYHFALDLWFLYYRWKYYVRHFIIIIWRTYLVQFTVDEVICIIFLQYLNKICKSTFIGWASCLGRFSWKYRFYELSNPFVNLFLPYMSSLSSGRPLLKCNVYHPPLHFPCNRQVCCHLCNSRSNIRSLSSWSFMVLKIWSPE